jgi:hypothetical protein
MDINVFDADAVLGAIEPPVLVLGGERYTGHVLSWAEMLPITQRLEGLIDVKAGEEEYQKFAVDFLNAMGLPGELLLTVPIGVAWPAVHHFLSASQASAAPTHPRMATPTSPPGEGAA